MGVQSLLPPCFGARLMKGRDIGLDDIPSHILTLVIYESVTCASCVCVYNSLGHASHTLQVLATVSDSNAFVYQLNKREGHFRMAIRPLNVRETVA